MSEILTIDEGICSVCGYPADFVCTVCRARFCTAKGCGRLGETGHHPGVFKPATTTEASK